MFSKPHPIAVIEFGGGASNAAHLFQAISVAIVLAAVGAALAAYLVFVG